MIDYIIYHDAKLLTIRDIMLLQDRFFYGFEFVILLVDTYFCKLQ